MGNGPDPDFDHEAGLLRNLVGATTQEQLERAEADFVFFRSMQLAVARLEGQYDFAHLCRFHRHLFGDVYPWAGTPRSVDIGHETGAWFAHRWHIEREGKRILDELASEDYLAGLGRTGLVRRLAYYLSELNALHPFREGNGRALRAFLAQLAQDRGYEIDWHAMDPEENRIASVLSLHGDCSALARMLDRLLRPRRY